MMQNNGVRFHRSRVPIDNQRFENCTFDECALVFNASGRVNSLSCAFNNCSFGFEGAAAATVRFMTELYKLTPQMVEPTFDKIRLGM